MTEEVKKIVEHILTSETDVKKRSELVSSALNLAREQPSPELIELIMQAKMPKGDPYPLGRRKSLTEGNSRIQKGYVTFTKGELQTMPKKFNNLFAYDDKIVTYRIIDGCYQARFRRDGYNIEVASKNFEEMKKKFIAKINGAEVAPKRRTAKTTSFATYADEWLKVKEKTTKPSTFKEYNRAYNADLKPKFGAYKLSEITREMIQEYLFSFVDAGKYRTAEKLKLQLNCIFDMAQEDFALKSPMAKIVLPYHEAKKGSALTKDEERKLVEYCINKKDNAASSALLILLYFGLRQSELKSLEVIDGKWLECETSKELLGKNVVKRRIPFTPVFKKVLPYVDFEKAKNTKQRTIASTLNRLLPNHHPHELRYTFITRVKESGVNMEVSMLWAGHEEDKDVKTSKVDRGYTTYSDEYLLSQAELVDYTY